MNIGETNVFFIACARIIGGERRGRHRTFIEFMLPALLSNAPCCACQSTLRPGNLNRMFEIPLFYNSIHLIMAILYAQAYRQLTDENKALGCAPR